MGEMPPSRGEWKPSFGGLDAGVAAQLASGPVSRASLIALSAVLGAGCLTSAVETSFPSYHNPLDFEDGGVLPLRDAGVSDGGLSNNGATVSTGTVDGQVFDLTSAIYQVEGGGDAGPSFTTLYLSDAPDFCAQLLDGGLAAPWNLISFHLAGDLPDVYLVAPILPPSGATAAFDWQGGDGGGFGFETGQSGEVDLVSVDRQNIQPTTGTYFADFADAGSVIGRFSATPCTATPPAPGE